MVQRSCLKRFFGLPQAHGGPNLTQAIRYEEDAVDEDAVGGALDLEIAEEGVGAEEGYRLVQDIVVLTVRVDVQIVGYAGWELG